VALELPEAIYSPQILEMVIYELDQYNEWYQESKVKAKVGVKSEQTNHSPETTLVIKTWQEANVGASLIELLAALRKLNLPVIHVTLAALPNHLQRAQLVRWFQQLSTPRPLILFSADRTLGGGVIVRTPNHIYDWSFRQKLEEARGNLGKVVANA
jgi:F0F1-type ATP synthase delta subunit